MQHNKDRQLLAVACVLVYMTACGGSEMSASNKEDMASRQQPRADGRLLTSGLTRVQLQELDSFVQAVMACRNIQGMNLVMTSSNQVLLSRGYGTSGVEAGSPDVDPLTVFGVASLSKAFATALLGLILHESEARYTWESLVRDIIPDFCLSSDLLTCQVTLRDLAAHAVGIPAHNYVRFQNNLSNELLASKLQYLRAVYPYRASYKYNNLMYGLIAYVTETIAQQQHGEPARWENLLREKLFVPLGMNDATFTSEVNTTRSDVAQPCLIDVDTGEMRSVDIAVHNVWGQVGGAGSVMAHAEDMAKWMMFHLNGGRNQQGEQVVPEDVLHRTYQAENAIPETSSYEQYRRPTTPVTYDLGNQYTLGWRRGSYRGYQTVFHTGTSWGYSALLTLLRDLEVAIHTSVIGDDDGYMGRRAIHMYVMDRLMGEEPWMNKTTACTFPEPWSPAHDAQTESEGRVVRRKVSLRTNVANPEMYVGTYGNYAYGNISVQIGEDEELVLQYGNVGTWVLSAADDTSTTSVLYGKGTDLMWSYDVGEIVFDDERQGTYHHMVIPGFEPVDPPLFIRGLSMTSSPIKDVQCSAVANGSSRVLLDYAVVCIGMLLLLTVYPLLLL